METVHNQESNLSPKLTMPVNFYSKMLSATDKLKMISKFYFVCELLPFVKDNSFSDENTIVIARTIAFQML